MSMSIFKRIYLNLYELTNLTQTSYLNSKLGTTHPISKFEQNLN
jgi:hypothetical protein